MDEQISFASSQDLGRYLQSLDSVRFAESDLEASTVKARVEVLVSLLFGQTIPIGEHQFLDSDGFINNAVDLVNSLSRVDSKDLPKIETIFPFRLGIRSDYPTIDKLIAVKLGNVNYKLSRWQKLDKMDETRIAIKKKDDEGNFTFDDLYKLIPSNERDAVDELKLVRDRFIGGREGKITTLYNKPTTMVAPYVGLLQRGLDELISWNASDLYQQVEFNQDFKKLGFEVKNAFDEDLIPPAIKLIEALNALHKEGVLFNNRSNVRQNPKARYAISDDKIFDGVLEIFDNLYNSSVARAVDSHSESASSARNIQDNIYVKTAQELSNVVINNITSVQAEDRQDPTGLGELQWVHDTNFEILKNTKEQLALAKMPWDVVWQAYLDPKWQNSLSHLNEALVQWDNLMEWPTSSVNHIISIQHKLDDAISRHAENIQKTLSGSILKMHEDSKTGSIIFDMTAAAGIAIKGAEFIINKLGFTIDLATTNIVALVIPATGLALKYGLPTAQAWITNGQIRKMFKRIYNPTP